MFTVAIVTTDEDVIENSLAVAEFEELEDALDYMCFMNAWGQGEQLIVHDGKKIYE